MQVNTFGVIGAGQMGGGIAQVAAASGMQVILHDISTEFVERGMAAITKNLRRSAEKGKISDSEVRSILGRITPSTDMTKMQSADFVVEAASENQEIKFKIFCQLDEVCPPHAILSSNTSSIPIGRIASRTRRSEKVIGMHFMNPVPVMKLVEVIRALSTSDETYRTTVELAEKMGKTPAVASDFPGFIANRILLPMINEAIFCLFQGVGSKESIDTVMKLGMNHPMGPLELADLIGLDTCLAILTTLHQGIGDPKYRPCPLLRQYVESGWLGRKSGRGFYQY
ncbi:3-hydroxybutyryl-CoA dehydrogenase [Desulforhopalus sp. IMCC35007]|uniref:3-hydroxybutyryl-CoA dehydrogenase n=1 Tax=Desulforhopalus sp. IMCC35007 TaxID=2569543 RepID=UPI0010ADDD1D|nr:3-hydroxybutyryl-CoA dehydrogenase [Desulforhopalus sp. IMCC35007]TKB06385.1 3-hydroxybutyryl-CoA dehydrogenase [Desulforhopalus sp. IMCC35007]